MNLPIEKKTGEPAYMQLYHHLCAEITENVIRPGSRLPSKREMARNLGLSVITVEHAYQLLVDEGYVESRPRSGFYVCSDTPKGHYGTPSDMTPSVPLTEAPEDFPFSTFAKTIRQVLSEQDRRLLVKSPNSGLDELKAAIAGYLVRSRGVSVRPEQIIVGSGSEYLYGMVAQLLGRESRIALEQPCYDKIRKVYEANGALLEFLPLERDGIRLEALNACTARALHVTPFHSYPSGVTATAPRRRAYAAWAREKDSLLIEDDYDSEFASATRTIETLYSLAPERVIYLHTFSKIMAPSMRMGFMVLPERELQVYHEKLDFYSCTVPVLDQYVLASFIEEGHMERYINRRRRELKKHGEE